MAAEQNWQQQAENFLQNETQFQLGFLPSEARNPLSMHLDEDFQRSTADGVKTLLACDQALTPHLHHALNSSGFAAMVQAMAGAQKIIFSGCGASGRLAILLESAWREYAGDQNRVFSIMTGGDFALVRSVENFEDHPEVGRQQVREMNVGPEDVLVGITATGETASVVGSALEAADRGAQVFMLICVPAELPASRLTRCRELYARPNVTAIAMPIGGMALTGSTRMQSSTIELAVAAAALEKALTSGRTDHESGWKTLMRDLADERSIAAIAGSIDAETAVYQRHGLIDYEAEDLLIDIVSDTTERAPTFMIPPYKLSRDSDAPEPWAMLRAPDSTPEAFWQKVFNRPLRCTEWTLRDYKQGAMLPLAAHGIPQIGADALRRIPVCGEVPGRRNAVRISIKTLPDGALEIGGRRAGQTRMPETPLRIFEHLRLKLAMNILSTGTMVKMGRVKANYMIHLAISNKKLIDRASRIIAELCGLSYHDACCELFRIRSLIPDTVSPVAETIRRLQNNH